jgi:hypothetical protein
MVHCATPDREYVRRALLAACEQTLADEVIQTLWPSCWLQPFVSATKPHLLNTAIAWPTSSEGAKNEQTST